MGPAGFGTSFSSVAKQVLQNNNLNFTGENFSAGKHNTNEGSVYHNRSAAIAITNNKSRRMTNHTPNGAINGNGTYHLMNVS